MRSIKYLFYCSALFCTLGTPLANSATLLYGDDGVTLVGATGVLVGSTYYDVKFVEDYAKNIYYDAGANSWSFTFNTAESAESASYALLDQVFVGEYDDDPTLTYGVDYYYFGRIHTPYNVTYHYLYPERSDLNTYVAFNGLTNVNYYYPDQVFSNGLAYNLNTVNNTSDVCAVWSLTKTTAVPVPSTVLMLAIGLFGIAGLGLCKRIAK